MQPLELEAYLDQLSTSQLEELYASFGDYETKPVSINTFLDDERFLGTYFQGNLFPYWRERLNEIYPSPFYSKHWLVALRGAIGLGKTSCACAGITYDLYRLLCLKHPQKHYGLVPSTKILFAIFNMTLSLATDVVWDQLSQMFAASPFFSSKMGIMGTKKGSEETMFPKRIDFFMGSRLGHTLGKAVFEGIIDEANFEIMEGQAYESFNGLLRRMESRFMQVGGSIPGRMWVVSSETDKGSAINKVVDSYRNKDGVMVCQQPLWNVVTQKNGKLLYSGNRFWVFAGTESRQPEIIRDGDPILKTESDNCIAVPVEHRNAFEADIHASLRDLAGRSTTSTYKLFRLKDRIHKAATMALLFPETIRIDFDDDADQIANYVLVKDYFKTPLKRNIPRYIHIDIGVSGDRLGIAGSYASTFETRTSRNTSTFEETYESVPRIVTEWCVGIEPKPGKQVPLYKVRVFIQWLTKQGYTIGKITSDGYQSTEMLQLLTKMGYDAELLSMDRTADPFLAVRSVVYEGRASVPNSELLKKELSELELSADGKKVDHPKRNADNSLGSKDVADAVAGSVYMVLENAHKHKFLNSVNTIETYGSKKTELAEAFWGERPN